MPIDFTKYGGKNEKKKQNSIGVDFSKYETSEVEKQVEPSKPAQKKFDPSVKVTTKPFMVPQEINKVSADPSKSTVMQVINNQPQKVSNYEARKDMKSRKIPLIGGVLSDLDKLTDMKPLNVIADIARTFYVPGGSAANVGGAALGATKIMSKIAPNLVGNAAGRVAQKAVTGAAVGAPLNVGAYQMQGGDDDAEALKMAGYGATLGGGLGALGGSLGEIIARVKSAKLEKSFDEMFPVYEQAAKNRKVLDIGDLEQRKMKPIETPELYKTGDPSLSLSDDVVPTTKRLNVVPETISEPVAPASKPIPAPAREVAPAEIIKPKTPLQLKLDELENEYVARKELVKTGGLRPEDKVKKLKGLAMEHSAKKREATQGELLIPVDGGLTAKELTNKINKLKTNYAGKEVVVNGQSGIIKNVAFGKVTVEFPDGTSRAFDPNVVIPKMDVDALIKKQLEPVTLPKVEPIPIPEPAKVDPVNPVDVPPVQPANVDPIPPKYSGERIEDAGQKERGFVNTLRESDKPPAEFKDLLKAAYTPIDNETTVAAANKIVDKDIEAAASYVLGDSLFDATKVATAHRLIDEFSKVGNHQRAVDIAESIAEEGTRAGQSIQAFSIYNRLSKEGILIHAQRIAARTNKSLPLGVKEVKVTADMAENIKDLAETTKAMTGVKDLSDDVMNILDRAKLGEKLDANDTDILRKFVNDSKQFIEEVKPKSTKPPKVPKVPKDKRVMDSVVSFLDNQEAAAKERLRARGIRSSSTPLDIWADYAIIGAAKMARGSIKFADWSAQMVKELGDDVKPHLRNLYDRARETFESSTKKVTTRTVSEAEKITERAIKDAKLGPAEADSLRELAKKISALAGEEKRLAAQDLQVILQTLQKPGILKKISTAQTIGQLLNPKTQVRNSLGNELFYRLERLNKLFSTPIDIARSKITGGKRSVTFKTNNQGEYWKNWMRGAVAGWKGVNVNGLQTQFDLSGQNFRNKYNPLTYMEKALGASLRSFDNAAYMRAYNNSVGEQATLRAMNEGQAGNKALIQKYIREADDNVMQIADEYGKYSTFQDNNMISVGLTKLKRGMNLGKDFGIGDLILKYPKTPGALLMRALEYSPAGFVRSAGILARPILKKSVNTAEVTQALSRAIVGTAGLSGLGFFLLDKGILTGAASKDKDVRDLQKSTGQGQYQVNLSALFRLVKSGMDPKAAELREGDEMYTYDWMQPVAMSVSMGANTAKNMNAGKQKLAGLAGTMYNTAEGGLGTLTEQSVLSGIKNAAQGYPGQTVTDKIMDILSSAPASFVPTYVNQVKQLIDNDKRETYSPNKLERVVNQSKAKIPGLADDLPQQYDTLGDPKKTYQNNSVFNVLFNPGFSSKYTLSPEAKMIVDLITESGDESLAPKVPGKTITVDGQSVKLNGDQFSQLQKLQGEATKKVLAKPSMQIGTLKNRVKKVGDSLTAANAKARKQLIKENQDLKMKKAAK